MLNLKPPNSNSVAWYSGPPPEIGWWPASYSRNISIIRYWDGKIWSKPVGMRLDKYDAGYLATQKQDPEWLAKTVWTHRWWEK
jgi:hypothetical protein